MDGVMMSGVYGVVLALFALAAVVLLVQRLKRKRAAPQIHRAVGPLPLLDPETKVASEAISATSVAVERRDTTAAFKSDMRAAAPEQMSGTAPAAAMPDFNGIKNALIGAGATSELAPVLLAEGQALLKSGNSRDGSAALRRAIEVAVQCGVPGIHALARLELAEIARIDGDLTTACEHWHLAKKLFSEQNHESSAKSAEVRMREHGCPTEWVLTDF